MIKYIIISAVRNEEGFIEKTIVSVLSQSIRPHLWIIVDDGSTDKTKEIIETYHKKYSWIIIISKDDRGYSHLGKGVIESFNLGLGYINQCDFDFLVKLDCDLEFQKDYFELIFKEFYEISELGIASGQTFYRKKGREVWEDTPLDHTRGATKVYRKQCFDDINGLKAELGWDTIDEIMARMKGWKTRSFPSLKVLHLRQTGSRDGLLKGCFRHGRIAYLTGAYPPYFILRCIYRLIQQPILLGSFFMLMGYIKSLISNESKVVSKEMEKFYQLEQRNKIFNYTFWEFYKKKIFPFMFSFFAIVFYWSSFNIAFCEESTIEVVVDQVISQHININIFGINVLGYDPKSYEKTNNRYIGYSNFGAGLWDPKLKSMPKDVAEILTSLTPGPLRFPGGCGSHYYDWKSSVGKSRRDFLFGLDEFLDVCNQLNRAAIYTISYFYGDESDAADLVEYVRSPNNYRNPNGHIDWANLRSRNGHERPYDLKYFEIGNEVWHGNHHEIIHVKPAEYAKRYLKYYRAMKTVDPNIKIGAPLRPGIWGQTVLNIIGDKIDFCVLHVYPLLSQADADMKNLDPKIAFSFILAVPVSNTEPLLRETAMLLRKKVGQNIPIAVTEYNVGIFKNQLRFYRYCLGSALLNAELLRIFMNPENNVLMANHWNFCNEAWGMIANGFDGTPRTLYRSYYMRPNYFIFDLYSKHFGDILIGANVMGGSYSYNGQKINYLSVNASKNVANDKVFLMVVNKNMDEPMTSTIELKDFVPAEEGNSWTLNGPSIDATNEKKHDNVKVTHRKFQVSSLKSQVKDKNDAGEAQATSFSFEYKFEKHSLTAIELVRKN